MANVSKEEKLRRIHEEAILEFDKIISAQSDERRQCLEDRRFYSITGAQWEGDLSEQFKNKPQIEVNKTHLATIRIINEYRSNRIGIAFEPEDSDDKTSVKFADTCTNLHRRSEKDSCAEESYDNAFEEGIGGGIGAWRLRAEYEDESDEENDYQKISIEPIFDADSCVFFDLDAKRQDKSDAKKCFVLSTISRTSFEEEYDEDCSSWDKPISSSGFDWSDDDSVVLAEYYKIETIKEIICFFIGLTEDEKKFNLKDLDEETLNELKLTGYHEARRKTVKRKKVHKYIMSGNSILEDCGYIAGKFIPIVPYYGKRWFVDNIERCMGHVRLAKDAQRLKNMQLSKLAELASLSSVEKPIFLAEQIEMYKEEWANDTVENYAFLRISALRDMNGNIIGTQPIGYTKAPLIPPAMDALLNLTERDIQDLLGNQQAGEQIQPNTSGLAVELVQNKLDMQSYIYISNMAKAKKRSAEIWLSMAKDIYVEKGRKLKGTNDQGKTVSVELQKPTLDGIENDFSKANFEVYAEVGPSSESKRASIVRTLTSIIAITDDPETKNVLNSMVMMNLKGEGIEDVREYFRNKLVRMGVIKPTEAEAEQLKAEAENQKPSANDTYLLAAAAAQSAKAESEKADVALTSAKVEKTIAETNKIAHDSHMSVKSHNLEVAKTIVGNNLENTTSNQ